MRSRLEKSGDYPGAIAIYDAQLGRLDESVAAYDAALAIAPKLTPSLYGRGVAKNRLCKCDAGSGDIAAARRLEPMVERVFDGTLPST